MSFLLLSLDSHDQARGLNRTGSIHSEVEEYPRKNTHTKPKLVARICHNIADAIHASARKTWKKFIYHTTSSTSRGPSIVPVCAINTRKYRHYIAATGTTPLAGTRACVERF